MVVISADQCGAKRSGVIKRKIEAGRAKAHEVAIAQIIRKGAQALTLNSARFSARIIRPRPLHR
jgi:hypothetical protein